MDCISVNLATQLTYCGYYNYHYGWILPLLLTILFPIQLVTFRKVIKFVFDASFITASVVEKSLKYVEVVKSFRGVPR